MNRFPVYLVLITLLVLTACRGTAPKEASSGSPSAPAKPVKSLPKIVAFGDSLTAGLGLAQAASYPSLLKKKLDADGFSYEVVNAGVSGDTSAGGVRRIDWALEGDVKFVILELGANDILRGQPADQMKKNLAAIIERAKARGATVLLAGMEAPTNSGIEYRKAVHDSFVDLAKEYNVALIPFFLDGVAGIDSLNQRDGIHRQAIHRGRVSYEPNSLGGGCPFQAGATGFVSFPEPREQDDHKVRGKAERFADHYTQATLFWNSQTDVEKQHIISAFRFELSRVQIPAIRQRMVSGLMNVAADLATRVAAGLGIREMPTAMPKVLTRDVTPEVSVSPALSLFARPGDGSIRTRRVAILVADGCDGVALAALADRLTSEGAVPRFVSTKLGSVQAAAGDAIEVDVSLEAAPAVLYDAVVLLDGDEAMSALRADGRTLEFIKDQYRHCKPILALGPGKQLLDACGIDARLRNGQPDSGLIIATDTKSGADDFVGAIAKHRHFARETDPPRV